MERPFLMTMIYLKEFTDLDFFYKGFFYFLRQMPVYLVGYPNVFCTVISQPFLARRHLNTMFLPNLENLNSFPNIFQETHDFLVLKDPAIICIYSRTTDRDFRD